MSSIAVKRLGMSIVAAMALGWAGIACAAKAETETAVVARLYKDFAWQAMATQTGLFGKDLAHQDKSTLNKYFAPALTGLLLEDAACQARQQGICKVDFDLLFDSQDPRVTDLDIAAVGPGRVSVVFKDPVSDEATRLDFEVTKTAGTWRISDIVYKKPGAVSLKKVLSQKLPQS